MCVNVWKVRFNRRTVNMSFLRRTVQPTPDHTTHVLTRYCCILWLAPLATLFALAPWSVICGGRCGSKGEAMVGRRMKSGLPKFQPITSSPTLFLFPPTYFSRGSCALTVCCGLNILPRRTSACTLYNLLLQEGFTRAFGNRMLQIVLARVGKKLPNLPVLGGKHFETHTRN